MSTSVMIRVSLSVVTTVATACITVNIYFPAPEVRAAAEEIVEETWGGDAAETPSSEREPRSGKEGAGRWRLTSGVAWAGDAIDIEVSTAAIRALKHAMKGRAGVLKPYLRRGNVGIARDGFLVVRSTEGLSLAEQAKLRRLVEAENRDRRALYVEIAEANGFERSHVAEIQRIFAETWIAKAETGWPIEGPDGVWTVKRGR